MAKVLIIKTGRKETFAESSSNIPSLGDVLRTTVLLHRLKKDEVHWVTSKEAAPLLARNPYIYKIHLEDELKTLNLKHFDHVLDLEKGPWLIGKNEERRPWQERLYEIAGWEWKNESYIYYPPPVEIKERFDIGLNWNVGKKWPDKAWDKKNWDLLKDLLEKTNSVSWQRGFNSVDEYATWIQSCDMLITTDSLGLHLALAMNKKVVALFGPTLAVDIPLYNLGESHQTPKMTAYTVDFVFAAAQRVQKLGVRPVL